MRKYNYEDFTPGDSVYHKSNTRLKMIIIAGRDETLELKCRWINSEGQKFEEYFLFAELIKTDDHYRDNLPQIVESLP